MAEEAGDGAEVVEVAVEAEAEVLRVLQTDTTPLKNGMPYPMSNENKSGAGGMRETGAGGLQPSIKQPPRSATPGRDQRNMGATPLN